jgi:hypothetical protein
LVSGLLIVSSLLAPFLFCCEPSLADTWGRVASHGIRGPFDTIQLDTPSVAVFNSKVYAGTMGGYGCQVLRYDGGRDWTRVCKNGFGEEGNPNATSMAAFERRLYAGTFNPSSPDTHKGCQVWSYDGADWTKVGDGGFGEWQNQEASSMAVYNSRLYVGTSWNDLFGTSGCRVFRFDGNKWDRVSPDGWIDSGNTDITSMATLGGYLYAGTTNGTGGCEVWRYDGSTWARVGSCGFGVTDNEWAVSMAAFKGALYVGTQKSDDSGCQVLRYEGGDNWVKVNEDGFGKYGNQGAASMVAFGEKLVVGTGNNDGCELWETSGGSGAPFTDWTRVNKAGFGFSSNWACSVMTVLDSQLFAGTYNDPDFGGTGCQVWSST